MSIDVAFTLFYILIVICIIYPPIEFVSAGFTIPSLFCGVLGKEAEQFIDYHIRRTCLTLFIYSLLPLIYLLGLHYILQIEEDGEKGALLVWFTQTSSISSLFLTSSIVLPLLAIYQIFSYGPNWTNHPMVINLQKFCNNNSNWTSIASDINIEYRRIDKICIQTNPICQIIATENWIIKVLPLNVFIAHQSDSTLTVQESDSHTLSHITTGESQFITIEVESTRIQNFKLRLNALDFQDLQDRIARIITVLPEVKFHKNLIDKFLEAFKAAIKDNVTYTPTTEIEQCMGCMQCISNIKIQKLCQDTGDDNCTTCYCKPMWCVDCLANWFAHRQDIQKADTWLSEKCTCPTCRARFCLLDVCYVKLNE